VHVFQNLIHFNWKTDFTFSVLEFEIQYFIENNNKNTLISLKGRFFFFHDIWISIYWLILINFFLLKLDCCM